VRITEDEDGNYRTPNLPQFALHVSTLWQEKLPTPSEVAATVQKLLRV
jgi:hypothetical protein